MPIHIGGDNAATPDSSRSRLGRPEPGSRFTFGDYTLPSGAIESISFDILQGVSRIELAVSKTAALAIAAASVDHFGTPLPIELNGVFIGAPVVQKEINTQLIRINNREDV